MAITLKADVGAVDSNSYETKAEADAYFGTRLFSDDWDNADAPEKALMMATRVLDIMAQPHKVLIPASGGVPAHYKTFAQWSGAPATITQKLAWPRTGMFDGNGNAISSAIIPQALKDALSELAFQLLREDRTLDSDISALGVTSMKAGPVSFSFKDSVLPKVIPDAVLNLMPASWFTDEIIESAYSAEFEVL